MFWSVGWPLLWAGGSFCNLDILYGGPGIGKLQFLIKKKLNFFFQLLFFFNFWSLKPWIRIGSGSGSVSVSVLASIRILWIRIRKKWIRIRNPASSTLQLNIMAKLRPVNSWASYIIRPVFLILLGSPIRIWWFFFNESGIRIRYRMPKPFCL